MYSESVTSSDGSTMGVSDLVARFPLRRESGKVSRLGRYADMYIGVWPVCRPGDFALRLFPLQRRKVRLYRVVLIELCLDIIVDIGEFLLKLLAT